MPRLAGKRPLTPGGVRVVEIKHTGIVRYIMHNALFVDSRSVLWILPAAVRRANDGLLRRICG